MALLAGGLQNNIHVDLLLRHQAEHLERSARNVGHLQNRNDGDVLVLCDALDQHTFHVCDLLHDCTGQIGERRAHLQIDRIFLCKLHAAVVEHLCAQAGKLQHLVEGDLIQLARARHQARVRGVNAVHVRVDLAQVRVQRGRNGHGAGVGAAASQGGDVVVAVQALEARDHHDAVFGKLALDALGVQVFDARARVGAVRVEARLPARQADGRAACLAQRHGQQRNADLLARGQQHIHLALGRVVGDLARFGDEVVGGVALGGYHHHHVVAGGVRVRHDARHIKNAVAVRDGAAAEFLYDECHICSPLSLYQKQGRGIRAPAFFILPARPFRRPLPPRCPPRSGAV